MFKYGIYFLLLSSIEYVVAMVWNDYMYLQNSKISGSATSDPFAYIPDSFFTLLYWQTALGILLLIAYFISEAIKLKDKAK